MKRTVVLYEVESGDDLPPEFDMKNIVCTSSTYLEKNDVHLLCVWCIEEQK